MFDTVIGPRMRVTDETVVVWMDSGRPARLVYRGARWRVEGIPAPITEESDEISDSSSVRTCVQPPWSGWVCEIRQIDSGEVKRLRLRRRERGWLAEEGW